jgi:hypothetical protein
MYKYLYFSGGRSGKVSLVTDRGGPYSYEMLRLLNFLENWSAEGGEIVSVIC